MKPSKIKPVVLLLVLLAALPIILVRCYFEERKAKKRLRRLRKERAGCVYLICSRRRGWVDFIGNNVAPAMPPTVELAWYKVTPRAATTADDLTFLLWRCGGGGTSKPLMMMVVFTVVFGKFANMPSEGMPYPVMTFAALLPWQFFANAMSQSSNSVVGSANLIRKVYFPRLIIPASSVISAGSDRAIPNRRAIERVTGRFIERHCI